MPFCPECKGEFLPGLAVCDTCNVPLVPALATTPPPRRVQEVPVATFASEAEARLWSGILSNEGIRNVVIPLGPGAGGWGNSAMLPHQLRVRRGDAKRARDLLPRPPVQRFFGRRGLMDWHKPS
jgi:hypothetical protein